MQPVPTTEPVSASVPSTGPADAKAVGPKKQSVLVQVCSFGIGTVLIAVNLMINNLLFIAQGHPGAGSLTTSFQSLFLGACGGALLATGQAIGEPIGKQEYKKASELIKVAYGLTAIFGIISAIIFGLTYFIFPSVFATETANIASLYLLIAALGNWPALALVTAGQVAFQWGDWVSPLLSTALYRLPSALFSYLLSEFLHLNEIGIGIGNAVAPWLSYFGMYCWLQRSTFSPLMDAVYTKELFARYWRSFLTLAGKMSLQRLTEWGNLVIITFVLGAQGNDRLVAMNPSLQLMTFFNLFSQGIGLGGNMLLKIQRGKMSKALTEANRPPAEDSETPAQSLQKIKSICIKSLLSGLITNAVLAIVLFFTAKEITAQFLADNTADEIKEAAQTALWINGLGLVADALRIISGTLLNAWDQIPFQNIVAVISMTIVGIPVGWALGLNHGVAAIIPMFAVRAATIMIAAVINSVQLYREFKGDEGKVTLSERTPMIDSSQRSSDDGKANDIIVSVGRNRFTKFAAANNVGERTEASATASVSAPAPA